VRISLAAIHGRFRYWHALSRNSRFDVALKKDGGLPPDSVVQDEDTILAHCEATIQKFHDPTADSMRRVALAPCSPFSVSESLMKRSAALARHYGVRLHTHLAETADEEIFCVETYGRRPLQLMQDCEFIGPDVWYAHGIFSTMRSSMSWLGQKQELRTALPQICALALAFAACASFWIAESR